MVVQHNLRAMNSNRMLGITSGILGKSSEKLSSGYKINRAADDAAGLSISEKMRKQIRGLTQASLNAEDGISAVQTAEGALTEVHDMLQRMNELAVKAGNGTMSESDRQSVQDEIDQLITEIDRVSETTKFNETYLLKGEGVSKKLGENSAHIGDVSAGKDKIVESVITQAKGNIFAGTITFGTGDANKLDAGTEDKATVTYLDENGDRKNRDVVFKTGIDEKATAANIADAINSDDVLKQLFKAASDANGKLSIESKVDGTKTDDTRNAVQAVQFASVSATNSAARYNSFTEVSARSDMINSAAAAWGTMRTKAVGEAYSFEIATLANIGGTAAATLAGTTVATGFNLKDGNSVTINGKTYTYDSGKTASNANSFSTLQELKDLLGSEYDVTLELTGTKVYSNIGAATSDKSTASEVGFSSTYKGSAAAKISALEVSKAFDQVATVAPATSTDDQLLDVKDIKIALKISEKSTVDKAKDIMTFSLQVGADTTPENKIAVDIQSMSAKSLGIDKVSVTGKDSTNADKAVNTIADAIAQVSKQRSALGAIQNRLEHTINNLDNVVENTTAAESQIRDTDMAMEMVKFANSNILAQAGQSMLAQANQANQGVLSLLG